MAKQPASTKAMFEELSKQIETQPAVPAIPPNLELFQGREEAMQVVAAGKRFNTVHAESRRNSAVCGPITTDVTICSTQMCVAT